MTKNDIFEQAKKVQQESRLLKEMIQTEYCNFIPTAGEEISKSMNNIELLWHCIASSDERHTDIIKSTTASIDELTEIACNAGWWE